MTPAKHPTATRIHVSRRLDLSFPPPTHPPFVRFFNDVQTGDSTFTAGTRTTVAGSIIIVFSEFFLIFLIGLHDEEASWESGFKGEWRMSRACFCGGCHIVWGGGWGRMRRGHWNATSRIHWVLAAFLLLAYKCINRLILILCPHHSHPSPTAAARSASKPPKDATPSGRAFATSAFEARGSPPTSRPQSPPTSQA